MIKCDKVWESVRKCEKVWESVRKCEKVWESVRNCEKLWESKKKYYKVWESVSNYEKLSKSTEHKKELKKLRKKVPHIIWEAKLLVCTSNAECCLSIFWDLHSAICYSAFDNVCCFVLFGAHFIYRLLLIHMSWVTFEKFLFGFLTTFLVHFLGVVVVGGWGCKVFLSTALPLSKSRA